MTIDDLSNDARVLVAVLPSVRDMVVARTQRWYRIPLARVPRQVNVAALAFYQTAVFGPERWAVRYITRVHRVRIVPRQMLLPEEPDHLRAQERYLCFEIGALERLPVPVPSRKLRRVTFIPTTLGQLLRARDIAELWRPEED